MMKILSGFASRLRKTMPTPETSHTFRQFDAGAINDTIRRALASAGLNTHAAPMQGVTETIQQALSAAGLDQHARASDQRGTMIEGVARNISAGHDGSMRTPIAPTPSAGQPGEFISRSFTNRAGTRIYKLYVPASYADVTNEPVPMVVMLHGCTQSPDDFAAGTQMNALAERYGFLAVYPAQTANANGSKCWNWFRSEDQQRDRGEPSILAGIAREVATQYRVDARRIFVAGFSNGASMAFRAGRNSPTASLPSRHIRARVGRRR